MDTSATTPTHTRGFDAYVQVGRRYEEIFWSNLQVVAELVIGAREEGSSMPWRMLDGSGE